MAINTKTPILPVGSKGAFEYKPKKRWYIKPGKVTLNIGKIIEPEDYPILDIDGLMQKVRKQFQELTGYELEE